MSYPLSEQSVAGGKPVELYRYAGTYTNFYYTSGQRVISFQGPDDDEPHDYLPLNTRRSAIQNTTPDDDAAEITIEMPVSTDIVAIYGFQISPPSLFLTVFRQHEAGEYVRYWHGHVENISVVKGTATIRVPSEFAAAISADFPNVFYQNPCNHNLFDPYCGIEFDDWSITTSVVSVTGKVIEVGTLTVGTPPVDPPDPDFPDDPDYIDLDGQLLGGDAVLPSGERRMIVAQTGNQITVNYPFSNINEDDVIIVAAGCDLAWKGDCKNRFNNTERFGGMPLIPPKNIFAGGIEPGTSVDGEPCLPESNPWKLAFTLTPSEPPGGADPPINGGIINPNWVGTFNLSTGTNTPNPGGGKAIDNFQFPNAIFEYNTPDVNPALHGQVLVDFVGIGTSFTARLYYDPAVRHFQISGNFPIGTFGLTHFNDSNLVFGNWFTMSYSDGEGSGGQMGYLFLSQGIRTYSWDY